MILLNDPWSHHSRLQQQEARRTALLRALQFAIWAISWIALGIGLGTLLR